MSRDLGIMPVQEEDFFFQEDFQETIQKDYQKDFQETIQKDFQETIQKDYQKTIQKDYQETIQKWKLPEVLDKPIMNADDIMFSINKFELYEFSNKYMAFNTFSKIVENVRILPTIFIRQMSDKLKTWMIRDKEINKSNNNPSYKTEQLNIQILIDEIDSLYYQKQIGYMDLIL